MPYNTKHVVNSLLDRSFRESRSDMTPMKLQKMLFYTHGWHLAINGTGAIDENFEAWKFGPVVRSVYHDLKKFQGSAISQYLSEIDPFSGDERKYAVNRDCHTLYQSIDIAWQKYIGISAESLSTMTHEQGTPWDEIRKAGAEVIPNTLIQEYFVDLATR